MRCMYTSQYYAMSRRRRLRVMCNKLEKHFDEHFDKLIGHYSMLLMWIVVTWDQMLLRVRMARVRPEPQGMDWAE